MAIASTPCFIISMIALVVFAHCSIHSSAFSGVYKPNIEESKQAEDFAAAFLVSKKRFIEAYPGIHGATNMAGVSFGVTRLKIMNPRYLTLMSRDYFDFLVEHLSATSNYVPHRNESLLAVYNNRIRSTAERLKVIALKWYATDRGVDLRQNETVALLVYSSVAFLYALVGGHRPIQSVIREGFIAATFWSVYRYFPNVVMFVASDKDRRTIEEMQLPLWKLVQLEVPLNERNQTILLPRMSLEQTIRRFQQQDEEWKRFRYVYFSEGDQILHMRHISGMFDPIDNSDGTYVMVPHRMQVP